MAQKENQLASISKSIEEIVELAHQFGGYGSNDMKREDLEDLIITHDNRTTDGELLKIFEEKKITESDNDTHDENRDSKSGGKRFSFLCRFFLFPKFSKIKIFY